MASTQTTDWHQSPILCSIGCKWSVELIKPNPTLTWRTHFPDTNHLHKSTMVQLSVASCNIWQWNSTTGKLNNGKLLLLLLLLQLTTSTVGIQHSQKRSQTVGADKVKHVSMAATNWPSVIQSVHKRDRKILNRVNSQIILITYAVSNCTVEYAHRIKMCLSCFSLLRLQTLTLSYITLSERHYIFQLTAFLQLLYMLQLNIKNISFGKTTCVASHNASCQILFKHHEHDFLL